MAFYEQVKPLWDKSELTLAQLAERCNVSESSASRYLNGKVNPPADIAEKIIEVLGGTPAPTNGGQEMLTAVQHIREIYEAQILFMQTNHASQVEALQKDKRWLALFILALFAVIIYLCIDGLHGNWGLFQYPVT